MEDEFRELRCAWVPDQGFSVVDYTKFMQEHEYHMMRFLMLREPNKRKVAAECVNLSETLARYFSDWSNHRLSLSESFYSDEVIGAAVYCFMELFDVVYGKKTYLSYADTQLYVSRYLVLVDSRKEYKADPVREYVLASKYHDPYVNVFDVPYMSERAKFGMRLLHKKLGERHVGWFLYFSYHAHHINDWSSLFLSPTLRIEHAMKKIQDWSVPTGNVFSPVDFWRYHHRVPIDPAHFEEDQPVVRGGKLFAPVDSIRIKELM